MLKPAQALASHNLTCYVKAGRFQNGRVSPEESRADCAFARIQGARQISGIEPAGIVAFPMGRSFSVLNHLKRALFAVLSRTGVWIYSRLPIFGALRAAVAIIRKDELVLVIARSDGRGLSFPGGFISLRETPEQAVVREVLEETGLQVGELRLLFEYRSSVDIPCVITVFEAEATGELHDSWEGSPRWLRLSEIRPLLLPNQREIVDRLSELKAPGGQPHSR